jgi:hypothetical protein
MYTIDHWEGDYSSGYINYLKNDFSVISVLNAEAPKGALT